MKLLTILTLAILIIGCQQTPIVPANQTPTSTINALETEISGTWEGIETRTYNHPILGDDFVPVTTCMHDLILSLDLYDYAANPTGTGPSYENMKKMYQGCSYNLWGWGRPSAANMFKNGINYRVLQLTPTTLEIGTENQNFSGTYTSVVYTRVQ